MIIQGGGTPNIPVVGLNPKEPVTPGFLPDVVQLARDLPADRPLKVLVVHSSFTGGHKSAADSLVSTLNQLPNVKAESFNTLSLSSPTVQGTQRAFYDLVSARLPTLRRVGFDLSIRGSLLASGFGGAAMAFKAMLSPEVLSHIQDEKPDIIVSTHSQTNAMLAYWKNRGAITAPVHSILTDFRGHVLWAQDAIARYYVAGDGVRDDLVSYGVEPSRVKITGIPVRPEYAAAPLEPHEARATRLGLDPALATVLIMGGSLGDQKYADLVTALGKSNCPMQIAAITAKNEAARLELEAMRSTLKHPLHVMGFVNDMPDWMRASDVIVTKPGGLTASEIFALRKPMIVANPYPGMEEHQAKRLAETGVAWTATDADDARDRVEHVLGDPRVALQVSRAMDQVSHPRAAYEVAEDLVRTAVAARTLI